MKINIFRVKKPNQPLFYVAVREGASENDLMNFLKLPTKEGISLFKSLSIEETDQRIAFDSKRAIEEINKTGYYVQKPLVKFTEIPAGVRTAG